MADLLDQVNGAMLLAIGGPGIASRKAKRDLIISRTAAFLPDMMRQFQINTKLRICHFLCQLAHECDGFHTTREYASGAAYEGRTDLGNVKPGDGVRFPGRGEIQVTGRANARAFTIWMRKYIPDAPDFESQPELLEEFPWAVWSAIWYWTSRSLNAVADRDDLLTATRLINGGKNGLADRAEKLARAKSYFARIEAAGVSSAQAGYRVLFRGVEDRDVDVASLQARLTKAGYYFGAIDGDFGSGTENAVRMLQSLLGLKADGIVGEKTWTALVNLTGAGG